MKRGVWKGSEAVWLYLTCLAGQKSIILQGNQALFIRARVFVYVYACIHNLKEYQIHVIKSQLLKKGEQIEKKENKDKEEETENTDKK